MVERYPDTVDVSSSSLLAPTRTYGRIFGFTRKSCFFYYNRSYRFITAHRKKHRPDYPVKIASVLAAMAKSFSCSPLILCVTHVTVTLPHSVKMEG